MTDQVTISVVIPCYNSEGFVERAIQSVLEQTYPLEEVICVDDGSTDGTLEVLKTIQHSGGEITIHAQENQGICAARNAGLKMTTGEYIAFLDHDDVLHPEKLEHQAQLISKESYRPDFVAAAYKEVWPEEESKTRVKNVNTSDPWIGLIHARLGRTSSNLWKASSVREVGAWQDKDGLSLDTGLMFRMLKDECRMLGDPRPLTTRYTLDSSASMKNRERQWKTFFNLRAKIFAYLEENDLLTRERSVALHIDMIQAVRGLYEYNPELALRKHDELVRGRFESSNANFGPGRLYRWLYNSVGFRYAEKIYPLWLKARTSVSSWRSEQR